MKLFFYTQDYENYGSPQNPHWKAKGGSDYILEADFWTEEMVGKVIKSIEFDSEMFQSLLIGYQEVNDKFLTDNEQFQLEYEGRIEFGAKRCTYNEFMMENESYV